MRHNRPPTQAAARRAAADVMGRDRASSGAPAGERRGIVPVAFSNRAKAPRKIVDKVK
jgi:hypothetical protein